MVKMDFKTSPAFRFISHLCRWEGVRDTDEGVEWEENLITLGPYCSPFGESSKEPYAGHCEKAGKESQSHWDWECQSETTRREAREFGAHAPTLEVAYIMCLFLVYRVLSRCPPTHPAAPRVSAGVMCVAGITCGLKGSTCHVFVVGIDFPLSTTCDPAVPHPPPATPSPYPLHSTPFPDLSTQLGSSAVMWS
uniref:HDC11021 n=1 Tax=Drosophila melanogaster TaxID=7227 RepID=Q6IKY9_DROME|nr:TPA_inf: HDC11021 [Drosophila melanogaster]